MRAQLGSGLLWATVILGGLLLSGDVWSQGETDSRQNGQPSADNPASPHAGDNQDLPTSPQTEYDVDQYTPDKPARPHYRAVCVTEKGTCPVTFDRPVSPGTSCSCGEIAGETR